MGLSAIALRNLGRRRARTLLTGGMIAAGVWLTAITVGMTNGTYALMTRIATGAATGQVQVLRRGYQKRPKLAATLADPDGAARALRADPAVQGVTMRVESGGLVAAGSHTVAAGLLGADPESEKEATTLPGTVDRGAWLPPSGLVGGQKPAVIDASLAARVGAGVGDTLSFVGQAADGSMAADLFTVTGISSAGGDDAPPLMVLRLADAQDLLALGHRVHRVLARVGDLDAVPDIVRRVKVDPADEVLGWRDVLPSLAHTIDGDRAGAHLLLWVVMAVVLLGVANTLLMSVTERTHELGVLSAIGTGPCQLVSLVLAEAFWLSLGACTLGALTGVATNVWMSRHGIPLGNAAIRYGGVVVDHMVSEVTFESAVLLPLAILAAGMAAALPPAVRAARLSPIEAFRS